MLCRWQGIAWGLGEVRDCKRNPLLHKVSYKTVLSTRDWAVDCVSCSHGDDSSQWEHPDLSEVFMRMGTYFLKHNNYIAALICVCFIRWNERYQICCISNCNKTENNPKNHSSWVAKKNSFVKAIFIIFVVNFVSKNHLERAFFELGLASPQNTEVLTVQELEALLNKLFHLAQRGRSHLVQPDYCVEVALNWLLKCLDRCVNNTIIIL